MPIKKILFFLFLSVSLSAQIDTYFYEHIGFDESGNEQTYYFLTKDGYEKLIVTTENDTLLNLLLQLRENDEVLRATNEALQAKIEALEVAIAAINPSAKTLDSEGEFLRQLQPSYTTLYNRYYKTSTKKNDFSMQEIDVHFGGDGSGTKKKMAQRIHAKL